MLVDFLLPPEHQQKQQTRSKREEYEARLTRKLAIFNKIKAEEAARLK